MSIDVPRKGTRGATMPSGPMLRFAIRMARVLHRLGIGRRMDGEKVILLTTRGARSGRDRTVPVMAFPDSGGAWLVVASFGGSAGNPGWFVNLARNPDEVWIELDGRRTRVLPATLKGDDRAGAWRRIIESSPRFAGYQEKTDREIPVVRLTPA